MVPESLHDFFVATASAAGALVGLLFVALSVWRERDEERHLVEAHALRATAALTVFTNALAVSLFALVPDSDVGETATIFGVIGLGFVLASALRLARLRRAGVHVRVREIFFLVGGLALFVAELLSGIAALRHPGRIPKLDNIADLVAISLLFGIARSWELIGGPQVGVGSEVRAFLRHPGAEDLRESDEAAAEEEAETEA